MDLIAHNIWYWGSISAELFRKPCLPFNVTQWRVFSYICALFCSQGKSDHWPYLTLIRSYEGTLGPYSIQAPEEETHPDQSDEDDCSTASLFAIPAAAATIDQREDVLDEMVVSTHIDSEQPDH